MFIDRLIDKIKKKNNATVVGLDPSIEYVPRCVKIPIFSLNGKGVDSAAKAIYKFNKEIIDNVYDVVPAVKLQLAYYEMYGVEGVRAFYDTVKYAKEKELIVIADGKRNDIGSTAKSYSNAYIGKVFIEEGLNKEVFSTDALTVNPYLGEDGIEPFIEDCKLYDKGIFVLVKTSNKSSGQLQDLKTEDGRSLYEIVAGYVSTWGESVKGIYGYSSVGAVVGATYPEQAKVLRKIMKDAYILVPGYGAQGGTADDAAVNFNQDGLGAVVNASRSIMCAYRQDRWKELYKEEAFGEAARSECLRMKEDLNNSITKVLSSNKWGD